MKVLVVDDAALDRRIAGEVIKQGGATAVFAENGREALAVISREQPDVVLTDLQMPEMDGLQLVNELKRSLTNIPVILMTAHGSEEIAVQALRSGAASYVPKSNLKSGLGQALRAVMSAVEAAQQRDQVRAFLEESESRFVLGYERGGPEALISYLQDGLSRLNFGDEAALLQVSTALTEALANAIEHGNLELDSALRESEGGEYQRLGEERTKQSPYRERRVRVTTRFTPAEAMFVVVDEGPGFDPTTLPDPTDPENLLKPSGRGIMLIRTFLDEVVFNKKGNAITMIKRRRN